MEEQNPDNVQAVDQPSQDGSRQATPQQDQQEMLNEAQDQLIDQNEEEDIGGVTEDQYDQHDQQQEYGQPGIQIESHMPYDYEEEGAEQYEEGMEGYDQGQMEELDPAQQMQMYIQSILANLQETGEKYWADPEFINEDVSLYLDPDKTATSEPKSPDYAEKTGHVTWKRPQDIYTVGEPKMCVNGVEPADVEQGALGDCWLLSSFMLLASQPQLLQNLIVHDGIDKGFAVFQFFKNGKWQQIIVDTLIPYSETQKSIAYARSHNPQEFWLPLLEKAYAKLQGSYESINGGSMAVGLVDVSGGVSEKFVLTDPDMQGPLANGQFFRQLLKYNSQGYLIGCANSQKDDHGNTHDGNGPQGILFNHAYGLERIEDFKDINLQILRIRNPWGHGEWEGRFKDEDEAWDEFKNLRDRLNYTFKNDGNWWMMWEDWKAHFNRVYVCKLFPQSWSQFSVPGKWEGNTAGGPYPVQPDRDEEVKSSHAKIDSNDRWFNNPQYRFTVTKKTQVIISLMQEDFNTSKKEYIPVNFTVVRVKSRRDRLYDLDQDDIVCNAAEGGQRFSQREITKTLTLEPTYNKKNVHYIIIPNTENEGKNPERPFFLRIFSSEQCELVHLPPTFEKKFEGAWADANTNGGRRVLDNGSENQHWCKNPQYFMNLEKPTHLKIILRKLGGKRFKLGQVGITVTKAHPPTTSPPSNMIGQGKKGEMTNKLTSSIASINKSGMSYAQSLREMSHMSKEKGADKLPEFEPPALPLSTMMERKLSVQPNEWCDETYYLSDETAAHYAYYSPTQGPFIIVPSTTCQDNFPKFSLQVYSSAPVTIEKLEDSKNQVISGKWETRTAGGCHLYDKEFETKQENLTWAHNPKYTIKLAKNQGPTDVKITLTRPEKAWKKKVGNNLVGCMIGLYVYPGGVTPNQNNIRNKDEIQFVPWNEITQMVCLDGAAEGYVIMPATYEANCLGPYIISVSTECEFTITANQ